MTPHKTKRDKLIDSAGLNIDLDDNNNNDNKDNDDDKNKIQDNENKKTDKQKNRAIDNQVEESVIENSSKSEIEHSTTNYSEADHSIESESYQVVARRYRPKTFEELVGQTHISQALANAITTGRIGHAYLFTGARGVGKTSTARIFSKSLNCVTGPTTTPCGECDSCVGISTGEDIDVLEIDGASNRGIDEIRQLRLSASICPSRSKYKIYIIDEVHMLTREAFNALLKILEEPPEHVKFIFCTTEPSKIPITILSRCQRYDFAGIDVDNISSHLSEIAKNEGVSADDGVFDLLARRAAGSMRDAQSLLEQLLSFAPQRIALEDVHNMLGTANDQLLFRLLESILSCDTAKIFADIDVAVGEGVDLVVLIEQMIGLLRDLLVIVSGGSASLMIFCSPNQFEQAAGVANKFGIQRLLAAIQILDQTYGRMKYNTQTRVLSEVALIRIAYLDNYQMISILLEKLRRGEIQISSADTTTIQPNESIRSARRIVQPTSSSTTTTTTASTTSSTVSMNRVELSSIDLKSRQQVEKKQPDKIDNPPSKDIKSSNVQLGGESLSVGLSSSLVPVRSWSIELSEIDSAKATEIWRNAVDSVAGILGSSASIFLRVQFSKPDMFIVTFQNLSTKEYCERELPRLRAALCQMVGKNVQLRLIYEEVKQTSKPIHPQMRSSKESRAIFDLAAKNPLVQKISEQFRTELIDAK
ncbi:MAG: DNA polymerase III subunit gamma/tau [Planctomycetaceae bacterium]|jgi:DNA polymerase-3 subunit gamma/tau|nr:DNA polymerase III subunit gamma/tau [Planctomycetaceae bacterium]